MTNSRALDIAPALIAEFARDRATLQRFRQTFRQAELDDVGTLLARAVARGELERPIGYRSEIDDGFVDGMVDVLIGGLARTRLPPGAPGREVSGAIDPSAWHPR